MIFNGIRVYVSGAFTKNTEKNVNRAMRLWHALTDLGYVAYCPHLNLLLGLQRTRPYRDWLDYDKEWLQLCHVMLRFDGDESPGAEEEEAAFHGPVFHSIEELEAWRKAGGHGDVHIAQPLDLQRDVTEFHHLIEQDAPLLPSFLDEETTSLRMSLVREETAELIIALAGGNLEQIGLEAVDLIYVVVGTLVAAGLDLESIWNKVQEANMAKKASSDGRKAEKPEGWARPKLDIPT